jgi:hypothetical protein
LSFLGGFFGAIFKVFNIVTKYVMPAFRLAGGVLELMGGNILSGLQSIASSMSGFIKNSQFQFASQVFGFFEGGSYPGGGDLDSGTSTGTRSSESPTSSGPSQELRGYNSSIDTADPDVGKLEEPKWNKVYGTVEGLVGYKTATGLVIQEDSRFVALPDRSALNTTVEVRYQGIVTETKVLDVGPWSTRDPYWLTGSRPAAEYGLRLPVSLMDARIAVNPAGIDLSNQIARDLGLKGGVTGGDCVEWRFK